MPKRFAISVGILVYILMIVSANALSENPKKVNIGTHSLSLFSAGSGKPTVVVDIGIGETYNSWKQIIDSISTHTRVVAYDRAGYGQSEPGPFPRNCRQEVFELRNLLEQAHEEPPYVLVGHSLGGLNAQYFANQFPKLVGGLVLLDPPPLQWITGKADFPELDTMAHQQTQSFLSMAESASKSPDAADKAKAALFRTIASEHKEMFGSSAQQVDSIKSFSNLPLTVIAAGKPNPAFGASAERFQRFWIDESKAITLRSTRGRFVLIEQSTHHIHRDFPQKVISEITDMLTSIRRELK
jgi:pimeloyl-ACP methyl ester carboxylesterase